MPSASSKSSQPTQLVQTPNLLQEPLKNAVLVADKKVRNLEKRRLKILETKKRADQGAELNEDQKKALENLVSVDNSLEAVKDVKKNLTSLETEFNKLQKKEQRKKKQEQREYEEGRTLQTLLSTVEIQGILGELSEEVRPDFLAGTNNACELTEKDLENLDTIYEMINPVAAEDKDTKLSARVKTASEHLIRIVEAKGVPAFDEVTYKDINEIITKIRSSGYFEKDDGTNGNEEEAVETAEETPEPVAEEQMPEEPAEEETPEEEYPPNNFQEEPEAAQPIPVNGVDLPPEVQEQETPDNEKIDFLGESEISSALTEVPALNPVSPEFVPRHQQGPGENGRSDGDSWQQVEGSQNQHHGNGNYRGRGNRGNRGFGRGRGGGRGNFRGGPRDGGFRGGNRGGSRGGGRGRDGDSYRGNRDDNYRGNRDGGSYRGNRDGSRGGGNRGRGNRGGSAPSSGGFGQPN